MSPVQPIDWLAIAPPLALAVTAVVVLLLDAFAGRQHWLATAMALGGLGAAGWWAVALRADTRQAFCVQPSVERSPSCSFVVDDITTAFWLVIVAGTAVVVLLSAGSALGNRMPHGEFHFLVLCSACGAATMAAARDLITLVVALELLSLPAFALVGLRRGDRRGAEAALKFFLISVVSTAVMLFGISLLYGVTGSVHLDRISAALAAGAEPHTVGVVGVVLTLVGLGFKVSAVPFHVWVPDTYVGAPVPVAAYLSVVSKAAGLVGLVLVLRLGFAPYAHSWQPVLAVVAALTMTVGNVAALRQRNVVRLLAWSSVAQAGFLLVPLAVMPVDFPEASADAINATMAYLVAYGVANLAAFAVVTLVAQTSPANMIEDYRGLARRQPVAGFTLAFALLCLAGLPPGVVGLFAKLVVFQVAVDARVGWLAVVMAVNVVIGLAYYLRWVVYAVRPAEEERSYQVPTGVGVAVMTTLVAAVGLSVWPAALLSLLPAS